MRFDLAKVDLLGVLVPLFGWDLYYPGPGEAVISRILRIADHLGRFGDIDTLGPVGACCSGSYAPGPGIITLICEDYVFAIVQHGLLDAYFSASM